RRLFLEGAVPHLVMSQCENPPVFVDWEGLGLQRRFLNELLRNEIQESLTLTDKTRTHELKPETKSVSQPERGREVDLTPHDKPPKFTKAIESSEVPQGGQCFFRYVVTGQPLPDIQWLKGSFHIQPNEFCVIINNPDGSGFIQMKNVKLEHSGVYTCKAFNQHGEDCCTADLLVMIYTISTEDRQIIPSEEVVPLREVEVFTAAPKREQHTHQAAVLQSHE
uniref:Ig-like domain-containing protein n=1 Tax=Oryzias sinensis TaxID=183150 RepID=A0A8C7XUV2_9TELE